MILRNALILVTALFVASACNTETKKEPTAPAEKVKAPMPHIPKKPVEIAEEKAAPVKQLVDVKTEFESLPEAERPKFPEGAEVQKVVSAEGTLKVAAKGEKTDGETHMRHPWKIPEGATNAVAVAKWTDNSWGEVEFSIGTGICPHRGKKLAETTKKEGLAVVQYTHPKDADPNGPNWFLHVNADKVLEEKAGQEFKYDYVVYAY